MVESSARPTVLHVDDDEALRRLVGDIFEDEAPDLDYVSVATGEEALEALEELSYPVLLLVDRRLPGTDTWSLVKQVEDALGVVGVPVFVLSGSDDPEAIAEAYANGAVAYLEKPLDADGFYDIASLMRRYSELATFPMPEG